jgi:hypothetical protein
VRSAARRNETIARREKVSFDAISIKPSKGGRAARRFSPDRFVASAMTLRDLLSNAYDLQAAAQLVTNDSLFNSAFDVEAKSSQPRANQSVLTPEQHELMTQLFEMLSCAFFGEQRAAIEKLAHRFAGDTLDSVSQRHWRALERLTAGLRGATEQFKPLNELAKRKITEGRE